MLVCVCICHGDCLNGEKDLVKLIIVCGKIGEYGALETRIWDFKCVD